jgi:hypothetical protein
MVGAQSSNVMNKAFRCFCDCAFCNPLHCPNYLGLTPGAARQQHTIAFAMYGTASTVRLFPPTLYVKKMLSL